MYNQEIKTRYLNTICSEASRVSAERYLIRFSKQAEDPSGVDIGDMTQEEIKLCLESMNYYSFSTIRTDIYILKEYVRWYNKYIKLTDESPLDGLSARDIDLTKSFRRNLLKDERELVDVVSQLPIDEGHPEIPVLLLSWLGLEIDDIIALKNEDVYVLNNTMFVKTPIGGTIRIQNKYMHDALMEYSIVKSATRQHRSEWKVFSDDLGFFVKNMLPANSRIIGKRLTADMARKKVAHFYGSLSDDFKKASLSLVILSGRMHRIMMYEKANGNVPIEVFVSEFKSKLQVHLNDTMQQYEVYKKAFVD